MSEHGACFDIGINGNCEGNCYMCEAYWKDDLDDSKILKKVGKKQQEETLKEYEIKKD